ncbi:DUF3267 domain-containing protein [Fodinibius sp. AD559]|uniref:DUF3267 domain-containing protein n=1 Tax=Fodinibius sp. AD559 TaxID=3424179 RepID=UPI004046D1E2
MKKYTLSFLEANMYSLLVYIPIIVGYYVPYGLLYGWSSFGLDIIQGLGNPLFFLIIIFIGITVHEFIHAVSWWWLDDIPWKKIHFGFKWKVLTPYVHCPEPVEVSNYRWGVAMPGIVLGIVPYLLALIFRNGWLLGFGFFFTLAASGDILILWLLRNVKSGKKVQDHSDLVGCKVLE